MNIGRYRVQFPPNLVKLRDDLRLCLTRIRWERIERLTENYSGICSNKLSVSICWVPRDLWIGAFWKPGCVPGYPGTLWICVLPCLPIRFHWVKSWGGRYT